MKYLIWLVVAWAVVVWMQRAKKNMLRRAQEAAAAAAAQAGAGQAASNGSNGSSGSFSAGIPPQSQSIEQMVQCAQCGIHFPKSEAIQARGTGKVFCCTEHRELHVLDAGMQH
jgi:uncharacterized protein